MVARWAGDATAKGGALRHLGAIAYPPDCGWRTRMASASRALSGSVTVIVVFPGGQHEASFGEGRENRLVQELISQLTANPVSAADVSGGDPAFLFPQCSDDLLLG